MKFLETSKDGGPESHVWAHWLIEIKGLFSIALLRFENGSRDAYHSHAFNSVSWLLSGELREHHHPDSGSCKGPNGIFFELHWPSLWPVITKRSTYHMVCSTGTSWVLTFRGPWSKTWKEFDQKTGKLVELTHGRGIV